MVNPAPLPALAPPEETAGPAVGADEAGRVRAIWIARIKAIPVGRSGLGVDGRPAMRFGLGHEGLIMLLGGLVGIGADDPIARIVDPAIAPGRRGRRISANPSALPHRLHHLARSVAAIISGVHPGGFVFVKVLGSEEVNRQGCNTGRRRLRNGLRCLARERAPSTAGRHNLRIAAERRPEDRRRRLRLACQDGISAGRGSLGRLLSQAGLE